MTSLRTGRPLLLLVLEDCETYADIPVRVSFRVRVFGGDKATVIGQVEEA